MKFLKKGFGGESHQQAKREVSAQAEISRFLHLCIQMPSLQGLNKKFGKYIDFIRYFDYN